MIMPFMTQDQRNAARRKTLMDHIRLLKQRYPEPEGQSSVRLLKQLLSRIPIEKNELQTEQKIQKRI